MISASQRPLPDNTKHSEQTDIPTGGRDPTISVGERPQTYALHRAATGGGGGRRRRSGSGVGGGVSGSGGSSGCSSINSSSTSRSSSNINRSMRQ